MYKRILSVIFAFTLIIGSFCFNASAQQSETEFDGNYFYYGLTECEKSVYDAIVNCEGGISAKKQGEVSVNFAPDSGLGDFSSQRAAKERANSSIIKAFSAVVSDHPEFYWINSFGSACDVKRNGLSYSVASATLTIEPDGSWSNTESKYKKLLDAAENFEISGDTLYKKVKYIHDELCALISYPDSTQRVDGDSTAYNALISPNMAVCGGYAGAFKLICTLNGIACVSVFGESSQPQVFLGFHLTQPENHQWNYVKMDDGNWYGVDLTWDDRDGDGILYDYFLSGYNTPASMFGNEKFCESHIETGEIYSDGIALKYPEISENAYIPHGLDLKLAGDVNTDGSITVSDAKAVLKYISGLTDFSEVEFLNADVNNDGRITLVDAKKILRSLSGISPL